MATRLEKAIKELEAAAGDRPFVLICVPTMNGHGEPKLDMWTPDNQPLWETIGLLKTGLTLSEAALFPGPDEDDYE